ncbi:MAG: hypothetical protein K8F60_04610 [Melioribacteraceae bacterium]|nr:hypothetical protein [Melioribacteraceae bacterium]
MPYDFIGDRIIELPKNYITTDMKGIIIVSLILDDKCNLMNYAILRITIESENKEKSIKYFDENAFLLLSNNDIDKFTKNYYPEYIHPIYDSVAVAIKKLQIQYSDKKENMKPVNKIALTLQIR